MTKKSRTVLFFICLALFLIASPLAVLYSQGYRLDFSPEEKGKFITKTGGFFFKVTPRQAEIYINGQLAKKTDFFFGSILIKNLLPKKYNIQIKKDGFFIWEKNLSITEKEVTEAKSVVLFPEKIEFSFLPADEINPFEKETATTTLPKNTLAWQKINNRIYYLDASGTVFAADLFLKQKQKLADSELTLKKGDNFGLKVSPDGKKMALFSDYEVWILYLQDIWDQPQKKLGQKDFLAQFSEKISDLAWINSDYLALTDGNKIKITEIDNRDRINIRDIAHFNQAKLIFNPADNKLYLLSEEKIYSSNPLF